MSADWDVDSYRTEFESDEHWELRKNFMLAHKDRLSEDETVCLAQVFSNIELLGCRYPDETMKRVAELAKGIVESFREKKKNCLKRTFVAASDAATAKVKGQNHRDANVEKYNVNANEEFVQIKNRCFQSDGTTKNLQSLKSSENSHNIISKRERKTKKLKLDGATSKELTHKVIHVDKVKRLKGPFSEFVLFICNEHPINLLQRNAALNKHSLRFFCEQQDDKTKVCTVYLNDQFVAKGEGKNNKASKEAAAKEAIETLQSSCYTIKIKAHISADSTVSLAELGCSTSEDRKFKCDIGEQIMKLMGWTGGGLGANQQGIIEPLNLLNKNGRGGLGLQGAGNKDLLFRRRAKFFLKAWLQSDSDKDLVFSTEFSKDQRKILHELAISLALKSKSYGKGEERHLVVTKKPAPWRIVEELMSVGGSTSKYELIVPNM